MMPASISTFGDVLGQRVLVCDGAMGTMLHAAGAALDRSLPELSVSDPGLVATIHDSYLTGCADIIQTNTFGANRLWLGDHGFPDKVEEINRAAVRIARSAAQAGSASSGREVFVAGSVSPAVTARQRRQVGAAERMDVLREQIQALVSEGVDILVLETFGYLDELVEAVAVASGAASKTGRAGGVPVIAQATFADDAHTLGGETPREVATVLSGMPITVLGTNCTIGPQRMLTVVEDLARFSSLPLSAQPNAGQPHRVGERRFEFSIDSSYFARYVRRFAEAGVCIVGGCCGTTPTHIGAAAAQVTGMPAPAARPAARPPSPSHQAARLAGAADGTLAERLASHQFVVAAGIAPPADGPVDEAVETVAALSGRGIGLFAVTPRENARTRFDSLNLALHLQNQAGAETIATVTTWDKTIMTLQADLLGAHALGIRSVICATGSPPVLGDYPAVDGVWEVDSLGLIRLLAGLNAGRDSNGLALTTSTSFCIGARINPGAPDLGAEIARAQAKVRAGAQFLVTRPVYELGSLRQMTGALSAGGVPVLASVAPLRSFEEADYLAHEVPGVAIPRSTLAAMERAGRGAARATGLELAASLLREARSLVQGVVLAAGDDDAAALAPFLAP